MGNCTFVLINLYAPQDAQARLALFRWLRQQALPNAPVILGGDFNVTIEAKDRTSSKKLSACGKELSRVLAEWGLVDTLHATYPELSDLSQAEYATLFHTYHYIGPHGKQGSSRLDRWYCSADLVSKDLQYSVVLPPAHTDHNGALLHWQHQVTKRPQHRIYPARQAYVDAVDTAIAEYLWQQWPSFDQEHDPLALIEAWEEIKKGLQTLIRATVKCQRKKHTAAYNSRQRRLRHHRQYIRRNSREEQGYHDLRNRHIDSAVHRIRQRGIATQARYRGRSSAQSRWFFKRFRNPRATNHIAELLESRPLPGVSIADQIRTQWLPILAPRESRQPRTSLSSIAGFKPRHRLTSTQQQRLITEFTESEVLSSIKCCQYGKACGPDKLPNDLYRNHNFQLVKYLTKLFNSCRLTGAHPSSYNQAHLYMLKKIPRPRTGLDCRPIALLNTDYKIYTRIIAKRLRPLLPQLIHPAQTGFVPGRSIHDTIYQVQAVFHQAATKTRTAARAMLLDIKKAYDTIDREYLYSVLAWMDFPKGFIQDIRLLHQQTRVQLLVNNEFSHSVEVNRGIRQGCPLAPLLFILGMEPLYQLMDQRDGIHGVSLVGISGTKHQLRALGYVDDTTLFLRDATDQQKAIELLGVFQEMSGLEVSSEKTLIIPLCAAQENVISHTDYGDRYTVTSEPQRLLGVNVGPRISLADEWNCLQRRVITRLHLAGTRTSDPLQRIQIVRHIIIPQILYIAQHHWPTAALVSKMQLHLDRFIWMGAATVDKRITSWMTRSQSRFPLKQGGLGVPDLRALLLTKATHVVLQHYDKMSPLYPALLSETPHVIDRWLTPIPHQCGRWRRSLWKTGFPQAQAVLHRSLLSLHEPTSEQMKVLLNHAPKEWRWVYGVLEIDMAAHLPLLYGLHTHQTQESKHLNHHWIPLLPISLLVSDASDQRFLRSQRVQDFFRLDYRAPGILHLHPTELGKRYYQRIKQIVVQLIIQYPSIMVQPPLPGIGVYNHGERLGYIPFNHLSSLESFTRVQHRHRQVKHFLGSHPNCSRIMVMYAHPSIRPLSFSAVQHHMSTTADQCTAEPHDASKYKSMISNWSIKRILRLPRRSSADYGLLIRMFSKKLRWWLPAQERRDCVLPSCIYTEDQYTHWLFECPLAKKAWHTLRALWSRIKIWPTLDAMLQDAFNWQQAEVPQSIYTAPPQAPTWTPEDVVSLVQSTWIATCVAVFRWLWSIRYAETVTLSMVPTHLTARLHQAMREEWWRGPGLRAHPLGLLRWFQHQFTIPMPTTMTQAGSYYLFFDGAARGNPGPAAAGIALVRMTDNTPSLQWGWALNVGIATNNSAEFNGLIKGLYRVAEQGITRLIIVGDSRLILSFMQRGKSPKHPDLKAFYQIAIRIRRRFTECHWIHQRRHYNRMADSLANHALDTGASRLYVPPHIPLAVVEHLHGDIQRLLPS